jgi:hypothetical protein
MFRPYRVIVFARKFAPIKKLKRSTQVTLRDYGYVLWTPVQSYQEARLPSAGSFLFPGVVAVREAAMAALALPETHQVCIKTNQDKTVFRYFKHNGRISGYGENTSTDSAKETLDLVPNLG